jgi:hypothetical protein
MSLMSVLLGGCQKDEAPRESGTSVPAAGHRRPTLESLVDSAISSYRRAATILGQVSDTDSARQAAADLQAETRNVLNVGHELMALGQATNAEQERARTHWPEMTDVTREFQRANEALVGRIESGRLSQESAKAVTGSAQSYIITFGDFWLVATRAVYGAEADKGATEKAPGAGR